MTIPTEWTTCQTRGPYLKNSLKHRRDTLRKAARDCRSAYRKEFMGLPSSWLADAYDEAAAVLDAKLAEFNASQQNKQTEE